MVRKPKVNPAAKLDVLASRVAHELNNQLTPLSGYLDLVLKDTSLNDPRRRLLLEAEQAAHRCAEIVRKLLEASRLRQPPAFSPPADETASPSARGGETILFVDDEAALRNVGRVFLERLGYQVLLAKDGIEAVDVYRSEHPQIAAVVLDMTMPKQSGRQTLKKLLAINANAKVLLASGFTAEGSAKELIEQGACDFLAKPYTIYPLGQMLRKVIDK